jgi:uncharacterized protein (TIGR02271 family)
MRECIGKQLHDPDGNKIGKIADVYVDEQTNKPEWFAVTTGLFGTRMSFVPIARAAVYEDQIVVPFDKARVKDAPNAEPDGHLSEEEEARLYAHYGISYSDEQSRSGLPEGGQPDVDLSDKARDKNRASGDDAMTRSEEELNVGTRSREAGVARLRKWVETEHQTITVPVQREKVRLEREPITDQNRDRAMSGPDITENVHEETLYEEVPVVEKKTVPKERVRLEKESVTDEEQVGGDVRKERVEFEGDNETK